ncbi:MAG: PD-(D/E)XK nuclease domain-containing protein, partial [Bullifex sp.]
NFYHGLLLGLFSGEGSWLVKSNSEAGDGFADIIIYTDDPDTGIVIEVKYSDSPSDLERDAERAVRQISDKRYEELFSSDGVCNIRSYGIAFSRKRCRIALK